MQYSRGRAYATPELPVSLGLQRGRPHPRQKNGPAKKMENQTPFSRDYFSKQPFEAEEAMFEFQDIFASQLTATVFVSVSMAMLMGYAIAALALCRGLEKPRPLGSQPR